MIRVCGCTLMITELNTEYTEMSPRPPPLYPSLRCWMHLLYMHRILRGTYAMDLVLCMPVCTVVLNHREGMHA